MKNAALKFSPLLLLYLSSAIMLSSSNFNGDEGDYTYDR